MGTGLRYKGGTTFYHSLEDNLEALKSNFLFNPNTGYFGIRGKSPRSWIRNIVSPNPLETAKNFYNEASRGGIETPLPNGKGLNTQMKDGTFITYRPVSSSDKSPAVSIEISSVDPKSGQIKTQKIHFIKERT